MADTTTNKLDERHFVRPEKIQSIRKLDFHSSLFVLEKSIKENDNSKTHVFQPDVKGEGEEDPNRGTDEHGKEDKHHLVIKGHHLNHCTNFEIVLILSSYR